MKLTAGILLSFSCILMSCTQKADTDSGLHIEALKAQEYDIDDVASEIEITALQDSVVMGEIFQIDMDEDYILLQDMYENKIHIFDRNGRYVNSLDKQGKGAGEYLEATVYAYHPQRRQIIVNSGSNSLNIYSVPECRFVSKIEDKHAYSALVPQANDRLLGVTSDYTDKGLTGSLLSIDLQTGRSDIIDDIVFPGRASIIYSYNSVFSPASDQSVYYCQPYAYSDLYEIEGSDAKAVARIEFGDETLSGQQAWDQDIVPRFRAEVNSGKIHALQPQYLIMNDSLTSFWYWCSKDKEKFWQPLYAYACNRRTGHELNIRVLKIKDQDINLVPLGVFQGSYVALIDPESVDTAVQSDSPVTQQIVEKARSHSSPLLVRFRMDV